MKPVSTDRPSTLGARMKSWLPAVLPAVLPLRLLPISVPVPPEPIPAGQSANRRLFAV